MLQKTPKASKGDKVREIYFNDFGITRTLTLLIVMYLKMSWYNNIEIWEQITIQFAEWKRGFAISLARKPLFHSAMFVYAFLFNCFCVRVLVFGGAKRHHLYQDKHTFKCHKFNYLVFFRFCELIDTKYYRWLPLYLDLYMLEVEFVFLKGLSCLGLQAQ